MSVGVIMGNTLAIGVAEITPSLVAVAANTSAEQILTVPGWRDRDVVLTVTKPSLQAGLGIVGYRSVGRDQVAVTFANNTGAAITPTAGETYRVAYLRPEYPSPGINH